VINCWQIKRKYGTKHLRKVCMKKFYWVKMTGILAAWWWQLCYWRTIHCLSNCKDQQSKDVALILHCCLFIVAFVKSIKLVILFSWAGWYAVKSQCGLGTYTRRRILCSQDRNLPSWDASWHAPTRQFWARSGNYWHQRTGWCRSCQYVIQHTAACWFM